MNRFALAAQLRQIVGAGAVAEDEETLLAHGGDKWFANHLPEVVVFARTTAQVSQLLRFASREKIP
ncbi:MAG TPA: FAD/FMN-containing dehydrogenase, partial [Chthoniobacterales bacterium]|nr:FAD/FMN-containing dehydrogenase [Chthoniobacterales bacterium]